MMNSGLRRLLSGAVALMLLGCSSALADTATVTARKLILREKASSTSDALQTLPKGTKLEILGKSGSWYKVTYGKYTGYVYKTYVSVTKTASSSSSSSSATRLEKGSTGSDVKDLQTKLKKLGYYDAYVDGDYGDTTVAAVKAFQKKYNLTADGIAGKETLKKLDSVYKNEDSDKDDDSLRMGDSGSAVKDLQTKLKKLGYYSGTVDSTFGSGTYAAVRAFQKKYNLTADGVAGSETLKKLDSAYKNADSDKNDDSLRMGDSGSAVKDLQTKLKKLGYYSGTVDSTFGSGTYAAVKAFQKKYNLTADGVAGSETLKKLDSAYKNADSDKDDDSLRKGATGSAVKDLQTKLKKLGFYNAYVDGSYGDTTVAAVKAFQKKYNLTADGVAGSETLKKLDSAYKNADSDKDDGSLRKGATGSAVKNLQTKLKKLGFYNASIDGDYGDTTVAAVKAFQKKYNLTADGVAGSETLKKLDSAYKNADSNTSTDDDSLRKGATGTAVKTLQTNLKKLGFYTAYVDGSFGSTTESAVKAFQKKYGLTADGVAGSATLKKIESAVASASSGKITTERLDWFNGGKYVIPNGAVFQIKDVSTGLIFSARRQSGGNHMDAEPLTAEDTAILKKINGGSFSWRRRAVLVKYNGHVYAASIYSEPHGTNTILDNNFDGQFCLHFYGSKTHGTDRVDADHQKCVEQAMKATW
jgi:peptidoglycan hydrolase-like protein with peptidoglycan-binding domain